MDDDVHVPTSSRAHLHPELNRQVAYPLNRGAYLGVNDQSGTRPMSMSPGSHVGSTKSARVGKLKWYRES